ncbi:CRISPR system precrRNA processing endoribonuclease RAMP protein Cas6 [Psychrobacter sp. Pi2-1]|uniref:CRISPR system precrRNA processing endoribonuclease RAMP protein Cas6 n=1 Tax=Psychrobacter sp. Pi2-1 TaxID=2774131 RepID=UPI00191B5FBE|nr:CRISPR system precrRNA processing endoribonuclease RAMP protein Cas6 [Psychrobacter sp. Pi2-1]
MHTYSVSSTAVVNRPNLSTIRFAVRQDDPLHMPEHSGSMLRGAFGVALRSLTCVTDMPECRDCPLKQHCKFPRLFEMPALQHATVQAVNPYVIHVPITDQMLEHSSDTADYDHTHHIVQKTKKSKASDKKTVTFKKGDIWQFGMTVMGAAVTETTLIVKAWELALTTGLGAHSPYRRATLLQADCDGKTLYTSPQLSPARAIDLPTSNLQNFSDLEACNSKERDLKISDLPAYLANQSIRLTMQFLTPFRYQQDNRIVSHPDSLDSATFIASLYNRIRLCQDNHSPDEPWDIGYDSYHRFKEDIETLSIAVDIAANHVPRRSNRQQRKMQLYGLQGNLHLTGDQQTLTRLLPALQLGEQLHIGKNTTMGLGQYQLKLTPLPLT